MGVLLIIRDPTMSNSYVTCVLDNLPAVKVLRKFSSKSVMMQTGLTTVSNLKYKISSLHVAGACNKISDEISRSSIDDIRSRVPLSWVEVDETVICSVLQHIMSNV